MSADSSRPTCGTSSCSIFVAPVSDLFDLLEKRDKDIKHLTGLSLTLDKKVLRIALSVQVNDFDELETNRMTTSSKLSADVAIYADEYEQFEHEVSRRMKHRG
jgi:hypothetical protein